MPRIGEKSRLSLCYNHSTDREKKEVRRVPSNGQKKKEDGTLANKAVEALIKCPFYQYERGDLIACEGYVKGTCMATKFPGAAEKRAYLRKHCFLEDGGGCFLASQLYIKYDAEDEA